MKILLVPSKCKINFGVLSTFSFLLYCDSNIVPFSIFLYSYSCSNFAIAKVGAFNLLASFSWLLFLYYMYCFLPYMYRSSKYRDSYRSYSFLKVIATSWKIVGRVITVKRAWIKRNKKLIPKLKQRKLRAIIVQWAIEKT